METNASRLIVPATEPLSDYRRVQLRRQRASAEQRRLADELEAATDALLLAGSTDVAQLHPQHNRAEALRRWNAAALRALDLPRITGEDLRTAVRLAAGLSGARDPVWFDLFARPYADDGGRPSRTDVAFAMLYAATRRHTRDECG